MKGIRHYTKSKILAANSTVEINSFCRLGISFDRQPDSQTGLDTYFNESLQDFSFKILKNSTLEEITIGRTHIYELTEPVNIDAIIFHNGVPDTIGVDIIYENEEEAE